MHKKNDVYSKECTIFMPGEIWYNAVDMILVCFSGKTTENYHKCQP